MATLRVLLPPVAMFLAILHSDDRNEAPLAMSLIAATFAGVLLGLPQAMGGNVSGSPWYFYERSNFGYATGFFANKNHMASLLLVILPFLVALGSFAARSTKDPRKRYSIVVLTAGGIGVLAVGLVLNRSMAGLGLLFPVAIASALMIERVPQKFRVAVVGLGAAAFLAFLVVLFTPIGERIAPVGSSDSLSSRQQILSTSVDAIRQFGPVGSGLGTFPKVYPLFEDPDTIGRTVVNHAHNDYVELIIEMGMAGAILIALFLLWWAVSVRRMLAAPNASLFAKAGAIGSAAILLHSVVDYPLRTAAVSSVFAMCLAMILLSRSSARSSKDLREVRHLVIE
jgi:O-antigen ligase